MWPILLKFPKNALCLHLDYLASYYKKSYFFKLILRRLTFFVTYKKQYYFCVFTIVKMRKQEKNQDKVVIYTFFCSLM